MAVKTKEGEDLSASNVKKVLELLHAETPISKKDACAMLHIAYNTTRLDKIISAYIEKEADDKRRRAEKRGKPASESEVSHVISSYLEGMATSNIAQSIYRNISFVKAIIDKYGVPVRRTQGKDYFKPELIPDAAVRDRFSLGERVYSARYDSVATIRAEFPPKSDNNKTTEFIYRVFLEDESEQQFAYQPASELASLEHITKLGIKI